MPDPNRSQFTPPSGLCPSCKEPWDDHRDWSWRKGPFCPTPGHEKSPLPGAVRAAFSECRDVEDNSDSSTPE